MLADQVDHVVAVELDMRMAAVPSPRSSQVTVVTAPGQALPIRSACLDGVLVSFAWHWLDADQVLPETARVLRPGGLLGVLWSGPDRQADWVERLL